MNPRNLRNRQNTICIQESAIAAEISGYVDLGMKRQALRMVRRVLAKRRILPEEFSEAVRTIGVFSDFEKWKPELEAAYNRQSRKFKRNTRCLMVEMYGSMGEWESAVQFLSVRKPSSVGEVLFGMDALLELNKLEEAKTLATVCRRALSFVTSGFEQSAVSNALATYFVRTHQWDDAIAAWQHAPLNEPFRRDALSGIVKIHLGRALEAMQRGLRLLADLKQQPSNDLSLCLPGNDEGLTCDAEKELLKFKRGIEKLLPEVTRKQLGMSVEAN